MDPRRLASSQGGLGPELLQAASREVAPHQTRANVLDLVEAVLGGTGATPGGNATRIAAMPYGEGALDGNSVLDAQTPAPSPMRSGGGWAEMGLAQLRVARLIPLGAAAFVALGWAAGSLEQAAPPTDPQVPAIGAPASLVSAAPSTLRPAGPSSATHSRAALPPEHPTRSLASQSRPAERLAMSDPLPSDDVGDDWLGAQFRMIAEARRNLAAGNPAEALRIIDEYWDRYPEGTLGPQAIALHRSATEARRDAQSREMGFALGF